MPSISLLYTTLPSLETAENIARALIDTHKAACVNVLPGIRSFFQWEGKCTTETEILLLAKLPTTLVEEAIMLVKSLHPYTLPGISILPITGGYAPFLAWIEKSNF